MYSVSSSLGSIMNNLMNFGIDDEDSTDYYEVIGCDASSSTEQIITEYRLKAVTCHPDKNQNNPNASQEFALLQAAKEVLTDSEKRKDYDAWRNSGIRIPYNKWRSMRDSVKMSMHWGYKKPEPMLESSSVAGKDQAFSQNGKNKILDSREEMRRKFRNYEI
uniref:dnaJ homolog subfamily C member 12-like n=1 Tax=Styela clava TaxID=7725 RepID=UPI001939AE12|nr:dnaJ homolog subfamily C member 12-like [Styela clava]